MSSRRGSASQPPLCNRDGGSEAPRNARRETIREEGVNVLLGQTLRGHGLSDKAERRRRNAVPDVQIALKTGDLALLECKWEDSAAARERC